jgi:tRNA 2-thiouridine synthesizing protein A
MWQLLRFAMDILICNSKTVIHVSNMTKSNSNSDSTADQPDQVLDITGELCPMTFVRTRLALDRLQSGQTLLVLLRGEEPVRNVPRTAAEQGHAVLSQSVTPDGVTRLVLRRK